MVIDTAVVKSLNSCALSSLLNVETRKSRIKQS